MILQYTKALLEEIGKISDKIFPIVNFYNSVEHFNSLDIDIEKQTKYYNMLINNHFKHIDRCLERAKKINYIDFNNAIKDFLYDLNLKDNIHLKIYNEAEELFHSGKYDKSFRWIYNEMKLLQDNLLSQKTQLEKFQKISKYEEVVLYFKIIENGEVYPDTKNIDLKDFNNPLVLFETINNLEFLIDRINHVRLDVYEAFMPELNVREKGIKDDNVPSPTIQQETKEIRLENNLITKEQIEFGIELKMDVELITKKSWKPILVLFLFYAKKTATVKPNGEYEWRDFFIKIGINPNTAWIKYFSPMKGDEQKHLEFRVKYYQKLKESEVRDFLKKYNELQKLAEKDLSDYSRLINSKLL
jgi:hypothetical protein